MKIVQSKQEELANAITHGIGAALAIAGLVLLIVLSATRGNAWHVISFSVFGTSMVVLYVSSTLYHSFTGEKVKFLFRKFDHMAIYLLIAGTYTPFCLSVLNGWIGWLFLGIVWTCACIGIVLKALYTGKGEKLSTWMYIAMGWVGILAAKPLYDSLTATSLIFLATGGLLYTLGTIFYSRDRVRYFHSIWHIFVLGGTASHFVAIITLLP